MSYKGYLDSDGLNTGEGHYAHPLDTNRHQDESALLRQRMHIAHFAHDAIHV
jgi:hypothetical protein